MNLPPLDPESLRQLRAWRRTHSGCRVKVFYVRFRKHKEDERCGLCRLVDRIFWQIAHADKERPPTEADGQA
jgi:hypothetical protein